MSALMVVCARPVWRAKVLELGVQLLKRTDHKLVVPPVNHLSRQWQFARRLSDRPKDESPVDPKQSAKGVKYGESELKKLANDDVDDSSSSGEESSSSDEDSSSSDESSDELDPKLVSAVDSVSKVISGDKDQNKSELLQKLQEHVRLTKAQKKGQPPLSPVSAVISGLKVQSSRRSPKDLPGTSRKTGKTPSQRGSGHVQREQKKNRDSVLDDYKLFQNPALGIFSLTASTDATDSSVKHSIFDEVENEELLQKITYPPVNAFEEMISWTKQGKMWNFPVDNEQGMEHEADVGFHEHVFLEHLLEKDFPKKGPVRHFMELVVTGLSKNPYITVAQKHEHVEWYKEYFSDKYERIDELTVIADKAEQSAS